MRINNGNVTFDVGLPSRLDTNQYPALNGYPKINHLLRGAGLQAGSLFGSIGKALSGLPIIGPILGNLFPSDEAPQRQVSPQEVAAEAATAAKQAAKEAVQQALSSLKSTSSSKKGGTAAIPSLWISSSLHH
jgi:hypothetical protein